MAVALLLLVQAETYLTTDEALSAVLPGAAVYRREVALDAESRRAVREQAACSEVAEKQTLYAGLAGDRVVGYALFVEETVKSKPITLVVAIAPDGRVSGLEVVALAQPVTGTGVFQEDGRLCRKRRYLDQFLGKSAANRIVSLPGCILEPSGATLSSQAVCRAVRKALHLADACRRKS